MELKIDLSLKPLSDNELRILARGRFISSPKKRIYESDIEKLISKQFLKKELKLFADRVTNNIVTARYTFYSPTYFTKKGKLNQKSGDVTNFVKALQDSVTKIIGFDDYCIKRVEITQMPWKDYFIKVEYRINTIDLKLKDVKTNP